MSFSYLRTIRFQDTDAAGVVYFANILAICHEAYEASLAASGINLKAFFTNPSLALPIIHANVDFFRPLFCGDEVLIKLSTAKLSENKFEINYELIVDNVLVAKANTKHVCIDAKTRKKQDFSTKITEWLEINHRDTGKEENL